MKKEQKIGVFLCACDGEISDILDRDEISRKVSLMEGVVLMEKIPYGCTPDGEETIQRGIANASLDGVVLLGCSPRIMEKRFQKVCAQAGLNPSLLEIVNLRDQCTWVHQNEPGIANRKAWDLVKIGIARARRLTPMDTIKARIRQEVVVIGGGIAGMTAALSLADRGIKVMLVEREADLGGTEWSLESSSSTTRQDVGTSRTLVERVWASEMIDVLTGAEVVAVSGSYGNYAINVKVGNKSRKRRCGAVVLAMGARELKPDGYYGYGENGKVITQLELQDKLAESPTLADLKNVVMIQCVGARHNDRPYCGRICCLTAVDNAILLKKKNPSIRVTILYRDIPREPGPDRITLDKALDLGIEFIRFAEEIPPQVTASAVIGQTLDGNSFKLPYDLVILSTPLIPYDASRTLANAFNIPVDQFGFIPDTLPNLKPHQYTEPCVHVVGNAHWPCTVSEATYQAYGRSARIASLIQQGEIVSTHSRATVDFDACRGCSTCLEWCPFDIPVIRSLNGRDPVSIIDPFLCKGCGSCVVHCPSGAATMANSDDETFYSMIEASLSDREQGVIKTIAFLCEWSGYAAADLAGVRRTNLPAEVIPIRIPCAGRVSTGLILHAFLNGADGVLACVCQEGDCHYLSGNRNCGAVKADAENLLGLLGFEKERFQMAYISPEDVEAFAGILRDFVATIETMEPSPVSMNGSKMEVEAA